MWLFTFLNSALFSCYQLKDVDVELRIVCEQFIQNVSESLISPLSAFLTKVSWILMAINFNWLSDLYALVLVVEGLVL